MAQEIARRFINGRWVTNSENESGGNGGSQPGAVRVIEFPFAFDTAGLENGVTVWTPAAGDRLLNAWFDGDRDDLFDGTSHADIGIIQAGNWSNIGGWFTAEFGNPFHLDELTMSDFADGVVYITPNTNGDGEEPSLDLAPAFSAGNLNFTQMAQRRFASSVALSLVVSADGTPGGGATTATKGTAILCLLVAEMGA